MKRLKITLEPVKQEIIKILNHDSFFVEKGRKMTSSERNNESSAEKSTPRAFFISRTNFAGGTFQTDYFPDLCTFNLAL